MSILNQIARFLEQGDEETTSELTKSAIQQNIAPKEILKEGLIAGITIVGEKFKNYEIFLPEVLLSARAMTTAMEHLRPLFIKEGMPSEGKIVIGTVKGDLHDIGKNLASIMLKGAGFEVIDLGKDIKAEDFVESAVKENAQIIGMSALLTTTMPQMKAVVDLLKTKNLDDSIKTIIGGAPVSEEFAREIGADAYAYDVTRGVERVRQLLNK
jgi:5-methyltetrahydrofolate--homocysteine methyltransferase